MEEKQTDRVRDILLEQMERIHKDGMEKRIHNSVPLLCELAKQITLRDLANCESIKQRKQKEATESWFNSERQTALSEENYIPRSACKSSVGSE